MSEITQLIQDSEIIDLKGRTKEEVIRELSDVLAKRPEVTDPEEFHDRIVARERVISTGIGIGLAMPHVKIASVTDFVMAIGRAPGGVDFDSLDGHPVHIVAMIGASDKQAGDFLKVLAKLVLKLKDKNLRKKILLTPDLADVKELLKDEEL